MNGMEIGSLEKEIASDSEMDLDISWIGEQERIQTIHPGISKEPMQSVRLFFLYLNKHHYIEKILKETVDLKKVDGIKGSVLSKEWVLRMIQSKKIHTPVSKYRFQEILQFDIPIEADYLHSFSKKEGEPEYSFLKVLPAPYNDIVFPESLFVFHPIHSLFFVYQEIDLQSRRHTLKSILKGGNERVGGEGTNMREQIGKAITKRVKILAKSRTTRKTTAPISS
jgi:hypothetical protein